MPSATLRVAANETPPAVDRGCVASVLLVRVAVTVACRGRRPPSAGLSTIAVSVVRIIRATDAALSTAERVTLTGSTMPSATRSP